MQKERFKNTSPADKYENVAQKLLFESRAAETLFFERAATGYGCIYVANTIPLPDPLLEGYLEAEQKKTGFSVPSLAAYSQQLQMSGRYKATCN